MRFEPGGVTAVCRKERVVASAPIGSLTALRLVRRVAEMRFAGPRRDALKRDDGSMP